MKIHDVRWSWKSNDSTIRSGYAGIDGTVSITDLLAHVRTILPDISPDDIQINFATFRITREATPEEIAERQCHQQAQAERHEKWERETYERLKVKYEHTAN